MIVPGPAKVWVIIAVMSPEPAKYAPPITVLPNATSASAVIEHCASAVGIICSSEPGALTSLMFVSPKIAYTPAGMLVAVITR